MPRVVHPSPRGTLSFFLPTLQEERTALRVTQRTGQRPAQAHNSVLPCEVPPFTSKVKYSLAIPECLAYIHTGSSKDRRKHPLHSLVVWNRGHMFEPSPPDFIADARAAPVRTNTRAPPPHPLPPRGEGPRLTDRWTNRELFPKRRVRARFVCARPLICV